MSRSVLWLIQCWLKDIPVELRRQLYLVLSYCLRHADKAVALNAASTLDALVKDLDFVASDLTPGFDGLMEGIFIGLGGLESSDGRLIFLQLMSTLMNTVSSPGFLSSYGVDAIFSVEM